MKFNNLDFLNSEFYGMVTYSIDEKNGLLSGLWTNNKLNGQVLNEIAKKQTYSKKITGKYDVAYIEADNKHHKGILTIIENNAEYILEWDITSNIKFIGKGFIIGKQLIVYFIKN